MAIGQFVQPGLKSFGHLEISADYGWWPTSDWIPVLAPVVPSSSRSFCRPLEINYVFTNIFVVGDFTLVLLNPDIPCLCKQCRSTSVFWRSQLIWIYTVCKGRVYPGSAGQGLTSCLLFQDSYTALKTKLTSAGFKVSFTIFTASIQTCKPEQTV